MEATDTHHVRDRDKNFFERNTNRLNIAEIKAEEYFKKQPTSHVREWFREG